MSDWLTPILTCAVASGTITGLGALLADNHCKRLSEKTIIRQMIWALTALLLIGLCFNVPARRSEIERQRKLAFRAWFPPFSANGAEVALDFTPPANGYYQVTLRDQKPLLEPASEQENLIEGQALVGDGTALPLSFSANESAWQRGAPSRRVYSAILSMVRGRNYHITVQTKSALARELTAAARVVVSPEGYNFSELAVKAVILSGIGTTFWLVAYGVFVAAAIRLALNRWG